MYATAMGLQPDRASFLGCAPAGRHASPMSERTGVSSTGRFTLVEHDQDDAGREVAEAFISDRFAEHYGACVRQFMPRLYTVRDEWARVCGAFGLRPATDALFLERYLDLPIEQEIAARAGQRVERRHIVEVGHFAGLVPGAVRAMIALLTVRLHREDYRWVAFTGTASLRNAFHRLGLAPQDIRAADVLRLPEASRAEWGSYYRHGPRVLVGAVGEGYAALSRAMPRSMA